MCATWHANPSGQRRLRHHHRLHRHDLPLASFGGREISRRAFRFETAIGQHHTVTVNALGPQFHRGLEPSRYGRPGRVPGSVNVSAATLIDPATKGFTTLADAAQKFAAQGVSKDKRTICYCGGGISATIDLFLLHQLGHDDIALYDGSMGEWAKTPSLPIETD